MPYNLWRGRDFLAPNVRGADSWNRGKGDYSVLLLNGERKRDGDIYDVLPALTMGPSSTLAQKTKGTEKGRWSVSVVCTLVSQRIMFYRKDSSLSIATSMSQLCCAARA